MNLRAGILGDALRWWLGALLSIVASGPRPFARGSVRLRPQGNGFAVVGPDGAVRHHLATAAPSPAAMKAVRAARNRYLDLDDEMVLSVRATLPSAARAHLRDAIALRMPELTPFDENEVVFDVAPPERHGPGTISVRAVVAPRRTIAEGIEELKQLGLKVDGAIASEIAETTGEGIVDFTPELARARVARLGLSLAVACGLLAGAGVWLHQVASDRQQRILGELRESVGAALENVREAQAVEAEIDTLAASLSLPYQRRAGQVSNLDLLEALTKVLPDDSYLTGFRREGSELVLTGLASDASSLIRPIEQLPLLSGVEFSAPIARDVRQDRDRFSITAHITAGDERQ